MIPRTLRSGAKRRVSQNKSPQNFSTPSQGPSLKFERTIEGIFDITCDGINPSVGTINFSLNDLPNSTEFTSLFDQYRLDKVEIEWYPEYTQLVDSALVSNAVNTQVNTAIDPVGFSVVSVADVLQYRTMMATGITKCHKRTLKPMYLIDGVLPINSFVSTSTPSLNWYGVAYGIAPTGVAMTFRSRAKYYITCLISR